MDSLLIFLTAAAAASVIIIALNYCAAPMLSSNGGCLNSRYNF